MIKKHMIACSGMLVLMVMAKLFIYSTPSDFSVSSLRSDDFSEKRSSSNSFISSMSFANEQMPLDDSRVVRRIRKELKAHSFANMQTSKLHRNAERLFPVVESILKVYGIPEDFKYIPLVESGLIKGTSSYRGASGYWQFMPGTARTYGLRVNNLVDERQDLRKSTVAACKYLRSMYKEFKSWTLVAAAYNTGENNMHAQIRRQDEDNYFKLDLNRETGSYVYKLIAMKAIIENPAGHGYAPKEEGLVFVISDATLPSYIVPTLETNGLVRRQLFRN